MEEKTNMYKIGNQHGHLQWTVQHVRLCCLCDTLQLSPGCACACTVRLCCLCDKLCFLYVRLCCLWQSDCACACCAACDKQLSRGWNMCRGSNWLAAAVYSSQCEVCVFVFAYLYLCICICVFVFVNLYLCFCVCVFVFAYLCFCM